MRKYIIFLLFVFTIILSSCNNEVLNKVTPEPTQKATKENTPTPSPTETPVPKENLALNKKAECDVHELEHVAENAVDGDYTTRWSGLGNSDSPYHYLIIDLDKEQNVGKIIIEWESIGHSYRVSYATNIEGEGDWSLALTRLKPDDLTEEFNLGGLKARYIKLEFSKNAFCSIYEIEIYEYETGEQSDIKEDKTNIAIGKAATSEFIEQADVDFGAAKAVDGDMLTRWSPGQGNATDTFTWYLDLEKVYCLKDIIIYFESCTTDYTVSVSLDNQNWECIYEGEPNELEITIDLNNEEARYICFSRPGGGWGSIYEFIIHEVESK